MYKLCLISILIVTSLQVYCQEEIVTKVNFDFSHDEDRKYLGYNLKSDTLNSYILLGSDYRNDLVIIYLNDSVFYNKHVNINPLYGATDLIKLPKEGKIKFTINNMPKFELLKMNDKNYYTIDYLKKDKKVIVSYSKYSPLIH